MADITNRDIIFNILKDAENHLTRNQITNQCDLAKEQIRSALDGLCKQKKIKRERKIHIRAFNRWQDKPQRWIIAKEKDG